MTYPRTSLICPQTTPYYHVYSRCVRRAFLCGFDAVSNKNYSFRKEWISERLAQLSDVFAINIASYAIMSNHYHLVLYIDLNAAKNWSIHDVITRWCKLSGAPYLVKKLQAGSELGAAQKAIALQLVEERRQRLSDISWFMRFLNEYIARRANKEDDCNGRFFEGRFKSQALLDEQAILTCMAYVDLNPIRASIATSPESSDWTSIQQRIKDSRATATSSDARPANTHNNDQQNTTPNKPKLMRFSTSSQDGDAIPFTYLSYLELIDWTSRIVSGDKRGSIDKNLPPILVRTEIDPQHWINHMRINGNLFVHVVGKPNKIREFAQNIKQNWLHGIALAEKLYQNNVTCY